jgi:hypothetical protein
MKTLEDLLEEINVGEVDDYHNEINGNGLTAIIGWYYVDDGSGVFIYTNTEQKALEIRLNEINNRLNVLPR